MRSLWVKFFLLLLVVSAIALSASLYLRSMMLTDFQQFQEGEMIDRVYWVTASLEGAYEKDSGWNDERIREDVIWALMLGMVARVRNSSGREVMNTANAIEGLAPLMKRRVISLVDMESRSPSGDFSSYPLFLAGEHVGTLDVRFFPQDRTRLFVERSNRFLLLAFLVIGGLAVLASLLVSRRLTLPIKKLERSTLAIRQGDYSGRVRISGDDEIARLGEAFNIMADDLQTLEQLRRKVIANVAHELRTPIAAMRSELEGMADDVIPMEKEGVASLLEEISRLTRILDGIDDLTQAQASALDLAPRELVLEQFLSGIMERFQGSAREKGVDTVLEIEPGSVVMADPDRLGQIVVNLLSNALRATPTGEKVTVWTERAGKNTVIGITDAGHGIPETELPHIFERFYRGSDGGLGLGLTIVKELVEAHGGDITVTSQRGKGTTFSVVLPVSKG
jgi:two-component system sensor histidine kinase BaeS